MAIEAVIFDMDGVLIDSEPHWQAARETLAAEHGKSWSMDDQRACMGVNTIEWAAVVKERLGLDWSLEAVMDDIVGRMKATYDDHLPLLPGALEAVRLAGEYFHVGLASGSATALIRHVIHLTGLESVFETVQHGDDFQRGKPAPDIYLAALEALGISGAQAVGIEDSANGVRALKAAGMYAIAVPSPSFPLSDDILQLADHTLNSLESFSPALVRDIENRR